MLKTTLRRTQMKLIFASDIHGSAYYLKKLLEVVKKENAQKLILLGDLLYHGPRNPLPKDYSPKDVSAMLNENKQHILAVRGNCDSEVDQMVLEFPILTENLSLFLGGKHVFVTHGHKFNKENPPMLQKGDILINGHFHVAEIDTANDFVYMNPGSISLPKNDFQGYLLFEDGVFSLVSFDGEKKAEYKI